MMQSFGQELGLPASDVSFEQWLDQVAASEGDDETLPVKKLAVFFKSFFQSVACGQVVLGTEVSKAQSNTLANMTAVSDETVKGYVDHWKSIGYLSK
jgi:hypothetical protein